MYCKAKKNFGAIRKFLKFFIFENLLHKKGLKGGFQLMLILGLLGMYFDAVVVFVTSQTLLFRLALAILWNIKVLRLSNSTSFQKFWHKIATG